VLRYSQPKLTFAVTKLSPEATLGPSRKVLLVSPAGIVAGKEIISLALARGLRDQGWDPEFVTSNWNDGEFIRRLESEEFEYHLLRLGYISTSPRLRSMTMTLHQLSYWPSLVVRYVLLTARASPKSVIHTNWHHALLLLPVLNSQRDIFWAHDLVPNRLREACVFRSIARRVARIICVSHAVAKSMETVGIPKSKIAVVHNGVASRAALPLRSDAPPLRLGIIGQIGPWKGHDDLLEALAVLLRKGRKITLKIFGKGSLNYIEKLKQKVSTLHIAENVEWCGFVREQAEIFETVDVCVMPSRVDESFGMAALEAGSYGRPVVCSSRGGLTEVVEHGSTGFLVESERPEQLANAIDTFAQNPALIARMGAAARERVETYFSQAQFIQQFASIMSELGSKSRA
jgi:glycosyltransferase involved in cell wall biosynthesis